jgi:hypothetical protein
MIMLALALDVAMPTPVPRTTVSETMDGYELACTVADSEWNKHQVTFVQTGGRAFIAPDSEGNPTIFQTFVELRLADDDTGKLIGMSASRKLIQKPGYGYGTNPVEIGANSGRATLTVSEVNAEQFAITIVYINGGERSPYAGFCSVKIIPQKPLSEIETQEYLRNPYGLPNR